MSAVDGQTVWASTVVDAGTPIGALVTHPGIVLRERR
jgi:hypothetical protein